MERVLLIEDNREIASMLFDFFEEFGLEIDHAENGELGLKLAQENNFDIILLDIMLPRMDGLTLCRNLREQGCATPILMLTALDNKEDLLAGFDHGADDYLTKPFDLDELKSRMMALIRRYHGQVASHNLEYKDINIDLKARKAYRDDKFLALTPSSYLILSLLVKKAPEVVTKEEIFHLLWPGEEANSEALKSHIYQLRNQLDKPFALQRLKTMPKVGFYLA